MLRYFALEVWTPTALFLLYGLGACCILAKCMVCVFFFTLRCFFVSVIIFTKYVYLTNNSNNSNNNLLPIVCVFCMSSLLTPVAPISPPHACTNKLCTLM